MSTLLHCWWQWFEASFDRDEIRAKSRPLSTGFAALCACAIYLGSALFQPLAQVANFRLMWLPVLLVLTGALASLGFWTYGAKRSTALLLTLADTPLWMSSATLAAALTDPPVNYAFAAIYCLMFSTTHARDYALTPLFAMSTALPVAAAWVFVDDVSVLHILLAGYCLGLLVSYDTGRRRMGRSQGFGIIRSLKKLAMLLTYLKPSKQWEAFKQSFDAAELVAARAPARVAIFLGLGFSLYSLAISVQPIADFAHIRLPWVPPLISLFGALCALVVSVSRGRFGSPGIFVLVEGAAQMSALAAAASLSAPPFSYGFAVAMGVVFNTAYARSFALTVPFAVATCGPALVVASLVSGDVAVLVVMAAGFAMATWVSYNTGHQRLLRRQNEGLRVALETSDRLAHDSMELALTKALLGVGNLLHELRNAQASVSLGLRYLSTADPKDGEFSEALQDTVASHQRAQLVIEKTVENLRQQATLGSFLLGDVLATCGAAGERPRYRLRGDIPPFKVSGDPEQLEIVLINLTRNAKQAGARDVEVECKLQPSAKTVLIEVRDNGPGIPKELLDRLFRPFATAGKPSGTGLGLYLSRRAVELMGGSIEASNRPEGGAVFRIRLMGKLVAREIIIHKKQDVTQDATLPPGTSEVPSFRTHVR